ncbi:MAG: amidohydrolase [Actinomycetota bacterium]|nr:amidohydrolase [Actinomycetota bacterium]
MGSRNPFGDLARAVAPEMVELRRELHRYPEVGWSEHRTTRKVAERLYDLGLQPRIRPEGAGLTVDIGDGPPIVAFRADLDALPVEEATDLPFRSEHPGVMHACGHDAHTAIGVGIATALTRHRRLPGTVRFLFQPAEECIPGGAQAMCAEGAVDGVSAIAAFHVDPALAAGNIGLRLGGITGASDRMVIRLRGPGGHTSRPHQTVDLAYAAGRILTELPMLLRQGIDPREPLAVVFGRIEGGTAENVIPTEIELGGTIRMLSLDLWRTMPKLVEQHVHDLVTPLGATAEILNERGAPPVVNHAVAVSAFDRAGRAILGDDAVTTTYQSLGAEDFAWYLESVPGGLIRLGAAVPGRSIDLHSDRFDVDEACIETGIAVGAAAMVDLLTTVT